MMMELNTLYINGPEIDYKKLGLPVPDDVLAFRPLWINLTLIESVEKVPRYPDECIITLPSGKQLQIEMTQDNLLALMDRAGLLYPVDKFYKKAG